MAVDENGAPPAATTENGLVKIAIGLVRAHYEPDERAVEKYGVDDFRYRADELAEWFDEHGMDQLASYVRVLDGSDKNFFVPM